MSKYLDNNHLDGVLSSYFEETEFVSEGIISNAFDKLNQAAYEKLRKEQDQLIAKFEKAIKENKYRYYAVTANITYRNGVPMHSTYNLWGSDIRPFTKKDRAVFFTWKRDMKAKFITAYVSSYIMDYKDVPPAIQKYIV